LKKVVAWRDCLARKERGWGCRRRGRRRRRDPRCSVEAGGDIGGVHAAGAGPPAAGIVVDGG
jgi:hypothetical protein